MTNRIAISKDRARRLALRAQLLDGSAAIPPGQAGAVEMIDRLGYVQIDTIAVVQRAHHHILWSRVPEYHPSHLHAMQAEDRTVFEYWAHAMAYLPMRDYRFVLPKMRNFQHPTSPWAKYQLDKCEGMLEPVLERIRRVGPLSSKDFKSDGKQGGTWWDWKPAKVALEFLFWRGELMITERRHFQKVYDLRERVLPPDVDLTFPAPEEVARFLARRAIQTMGVAEERDIVRFLQPGSARDSDWQSVERDRVREAIHELVEAGEWIELRVEGLKGLYYGPAALMHEIEAAGSDPVGLSILSPFDNVLILRDRVRRLFDFDYTLECYVPEAKRKYGYFVMPILWNGKLIGRLDPRADRPSKTLFIQNIHFESNSPPAEDALRSLAEALVRMARFNGCERVKLQGRMPVGVKTALSAHLRQ